MADVPRVLQEFDDGATIVLQGLHHFWLPLARYCRHLEAYLGHAAQANAYFTPRGSQGLPVHHDTHEVISLQVSGEKRWLVYEPVLELPLKNQRYRSALGAPGEPVLDVTLRAGDTMYLPRGWLHQALTSGSDSLHVTIGVNVPRWIDAARAELEAREHELSYRRTIDGVPPPELPGLDADAARQRARDRFVRSRRPILDGQLSELRALDGLDTSTELVRRDTVIADLHGTRLVFEGKELRFPERLSAELEFLVTAEAPFCGSDLPGRSTMQDASCCSDDSCARGSCDVAPRSPELLRRAGEVRRLAVLAPDLDVVPRPRRLDARTPAFALGLDLRDPDVVDAEQSRRLAHGSLCGLRGEPVARATPVGGQVDATLQRCLDHRPGVSRLDAAVVDAVGERDEVAGEAVAADVSRLPCPPVLDLLADRLVERPAVPGAATVVLPVRADEKEGVLDRRACRFEVEPDQVVVTLELEPAQVAPVLRRPGHEREQPVLAATLGPADEEDARVRQPCALGPQVGLQLRAQRRAVDGVVRPEPAILEQDPRVDAARGRCERLCVGPRRLRTERPTRPGRGRSPARSRPPRRE